MHGSPIVVAEKRYGTYTILDRLLPPFGARIEKHLAGELTTGSLPVMLGLCSRLTEWCYYDPNTQGPTDRVLY